MIVLPDTSPPAPPSNRGWQVLLGVGVVLAVAILVMVWFRAESSTDFRDFWKNAVHFRETGAIANDQGVHNYLPFFTVFMVPWGFLPLRVAAVIFVLLSLALFALTARLVEALLNDGLRRGPRRALLVTLGLALPYVYACAVVGNLGLLLLFLVVTTWFLVERGREWEAGAALGLATLIKLVPGVLIIFFLLKRRWRVAGTAVAVLVVLGLGLPLAAVGYKQTVADHRGFYERAVRAHSAYQTITADRPRKAHYNNNAIPIVLRRLLSPVDGRARLLPSRAREGEAPAEPLDGRARLPLSRGVDGGSSDCGNRLAVNIADWPREAILGLYMALIAGFLGVSIVVTLRGPRLWPPENLVELRSLRGQYGVWCCLMLLASPLVWTHYLPLAYWPLALLADRCVAPASSRWSISNGKPKAERTDRATGKPCWLSISALLVWLAGAILLAWPTARAAGAQIAGVAWLWLVSVFCILWARKSPP
ncbi:MAG: DUF2029 domain-containing protein [Phycisphaerae bacterium]|nr:DUF2029 domain-containing protein [Phycisphaerae bacterium]